MTDRANEGQAPAASRGFRAGLLDGQVAIVTGGGSGLGRATAVELAALGARVIVCGRRPEPLGETAALGPDGVIEPIACDIREEEQVDGLVERVLDRHRRIDLLVNNAGGQFLSPAAGMAHSSAPAAVENLMRVLAVEWSRFGIRCNSIAAGQFATDTLLTKYPQPIVDALAGTIPLGRLGEPDELAWLVAYLASPAGDFVSGAALTVDGARDNWFGARPPTAAADESGRPLAERRRSGSGETV